MKTKVLFLLGAILCATGTSSAQTVYVAGYEEDGAYSSIIKVWKNGELLYNLTDDMHDEQVHSIVVWGNDVYVAGCERGNTGKYIAKVWKNDEELYVLNDGSDYAYARNLLLWKGDIYIAGDEYRASGWGFGKVWKNGEILYNLGDHAQVSAMCIFNDDLYVCGEVNIDGIQRGSLWKNGDQLFTFAPGGNLIDLSYKHSHVYDMCASASYLYIAANFFQSTADTKASLAVTRYSYNDFHNQITDVPVLYTYKPVDMYEYASFPMDVEDDDIYVAVADATDKVYKNASLLYNMGSITMEDIAVWKGDVYVAGYESGSNLAKVWKNGEQLYTFGNGEKTMNACRIFITSGSGADVKKVENNPVTLHHLFAGDQITLSGLQGNETLRFYTGVGNLLFSGKATGETSTVSVTHLPAGVYFISIQTDASVSTHKFIKQ